MPEDFRNLPPFKGLKERLTSLPRQQRKIGEAALHSPELIAFGTIRDVAQRLGTNSATIVRFAQALGYAGYTEFQGTVRVAFLQNAADTQMTASSAPALRTPEEGLAFTRSQQRSNLERLFEHLDTIDLEAITKVLESGRRITVFAEAAADIPGALLVRLMRHVKLSATLVSNEIDGTIAVYDATKEDVVVIFSLSVTFRGALSVAKLAEEKGATVIAIVGSELSPLRKHASYVVIAPTRSSTMWYSTVSSVAAVELMMSQIASRRRDIVLNEERRLYEVYLDKALLAPLGSDDEPPLSNSDDTNERT